MHCFRENDVFLQTGTDVMVLYQLEGAVYNVGFWKADYGSLVMFHRNCSSILHSFRDIEVFLQTENDVIDISPQGALCKNLNDGIRKGDNDFLLVFNSNFISIMHRFCDNDVFLQTENDVMVLYPLGGAVRSL